VAPDPLDEAFSGACLWILERRGGDPRFLAVHPAPPERGSGISFEVGELSRIELSHARGTPHVFLGIGTASRERHDALWKHAGGSENAVSLRLGDCFEQAGLSETVFVERIHDREHWIGARLKATREELDSLEGRERLLRMIEGFHLAFSVRETRR
jgi:hypothetical protein